MDNSYQECTADSGSWPILRSAGPASQRPSPHPLGIDIGLLASLYPSLALSIRSLLLSPPWMCGHPYGVDADAPTRSDVRCRAWRLQWTHAMPEVRPGRFQFQRPSSDTVDPVDGQILPRLCSILMFFIDWVLPMGLQYADSSASLSPGLPAAQDVMLYIMWCTRMRCCLYLVVDEE